MPTAPIEVPPIGQPLRRPLPGGNLVEHARGRRKPRTGTGVPLGPVSKCWVEPRRGPDGDPARRRFVWIPVLYPAETPTRPVVVWARRRPARHFETGPRRSVYLSLRDRPGGGVHGTVARVATTVLLLGTVSLLTDVSSELVAAVLPLYLTAQAVVGLIAYGFVDGLYQAVSALVRMAGGD